ncbi:MAG TPA: hypothetical protein VIH42_15355, partial [Thermoguttaceae bacterium]
MRHLIPRTNRCIILCSTFGPVGSMNFKYASAESVISHREVGGPKIIKSPPLGDSKVGSIKSRPVIQSTARRKQPPNQTFRAILPP